MRLTTPQLSLTLDEKGSVTSLCCGRGVDRLIPSSEGYPLLSIKSSRDDTHHAPTGMRRGEDEGRPSLWFEFPDSGVEVAYDSQNGYLRCEVVAIEGAEVENLQWGPIRITHDQRVGESLGFASDGEHAIGLLSLNLLTTGGHDHGPEIDREFPALAVEGGGSLSAFARDRRVEIDRPSVYAQATHVMPMPDESCVGSAIALYGSPANDVLETVASIVQREGLFYPTRDGRWLKTEPDMTDSMFIVEFDRENIDDCLDLAERAGLDIVYHPDIFRTWGTFEPKTPIDDLRACVQRAQQRGMQLGAHTLTAFITPNDALVTPVPDPGLQVCGVTTITQALGPGDTEIALAPDAVVSDYELVPGLNVVRLGDELIEYSRVSEDRPAVLTGCQRGAFGTVAASHGAGTTIAKLATHPYKTFFPDIQMQDRVAKNLAAFYNRTGMSVLSFDGLEGCRATGHGYYACERFIKIFFDHAENKNILATSSQLPHFGWHYLANISWGEPWYGGFRDSQIDHRLKSKRFCDRNFMPAKLGQFKVTSDTTVEDIDWVMGLCAGHDTGVDLYISPGFMREHDHAADVLDTIRRWETARRRDTFTADQRRSLRDPQLLHRLTQSNDEYQLGKPERFDQQSSADEHSAQTLPAEIFEQVRRHGFVTDDHVHINQPREPGQPTAAEIELELFGRPQPLRFALRSDPENDQAVAAAYIKLGAAVCELPFVIQPGGYVIATGDGAAQHYSAGDELLDEQPIPPLTLAAGKNAVEFNTARPADRPGPTVTLNFALFNEGYSLTTGKPVSSSNDSPQAAWVNDGKYRDCQRCWVAPVGERGSAWWRVDLEAVHTLRQIVVVPYFDGPRYYQYTVEGSIDGETWQTLVDQSDNTRLVPSDGQCVAGIPPTAVRFLRVNMLKHSIDREVHLVEVMAFD